VSVVIEVFAKIIAGTIALAFWLTFGLAAWLRVLIFALTTYTLSLTFAPFSGHSASAAHLHHAIYFWKQGFDQILRSLFGRHQQDGAVVATPGDPAALAAAEQRTELSFWAGLWGFLKELTFTLIFWGAVLIALHVAGVVRLPALAQFSVERSEAPASRRTQEAPKRAPREERPAQTAQTEEVERIECETEGEPRTLAPDTRYRAKREVNVRAAPTTRARNLGKLAGGEIVTGVATLGADWLMVSNERFGGCYVATRYFERAD